VKIKAYGDYLVSLMRERCLSARSACSKQKGISSRAEGPEVIVNLTTIPSRLDRVHLAVESLLRQTVKPHRICLWLSGKCLESPLTFLLKRQCLRGLEIRECRDIGPHTKLIHSLKAYPEAVHVTADDDHLYPPDWLASILAGWSADPAKVACGRARWIGMDPSGELLPYRQWKFAGAQAGPSHLLMALNYGGTLYRKGFLHEAVFDEEAMLRLCPFADDIWLKCMCLLKGTEVRTIQPMSGSLHMITGTQASSLRKQNVLEDKNRLQLQNTLDHFKVTLHALR